MTTYDVPMELQTLDKNLWETSAARFNAAERLARQSALSLYAGAALSLAATMLGAATLLRPSAAMTLAAMLASAVALAFSLIEASAGHGVKSERLHACALRLRALMREAPALGAEVAAARYAAITAECPDNHLPMDWALVHARRKQRGWRTELPYALVAYGWRAALLVAGLVGAVAPLGWV